MSNLNDWLIVDGAFFVIRCIILLSNKTEKKMKQVACLLYLSKRCSVERSLHRPIDSRHDRNDDSTMHRDQNYTGLDLHATYIEFC